MALLHREDMSRVAGAWTFVGSPQRQGLPRSGQRTQEMSQVLVSGGKRERTMLPLLAHVSL